MRGRISAIFALKLLALALTVIISACDNNPLQKNTGNPLPGKIVFSAKRVGSDYNQIYTVNADGTDLRQVTFFAEDNAYSPSWSPGGDSILFASDSLFSFDAGGFELFIISADGANLQRVKKDSIYFARGYQPAWSPRGERLAFYTCGFGGCGGSRLILVRDRPDGWLWWAKGGFDPAWSLDGSLLAYIGSDPETGQDQLATSELTSFYSPVERLTHIDSKKRTPSWSPDGSRIAFISDTQILIHNLKRSTEEELALVDVPVGQVPLELHAWVAADEELLLVTFKKPGQVYDPQQGYNHRYFLYAVNIQTGELTSILPDSTLQGADWHLPQ